MSKLTKAERARMQTNPMGRLDLDGASSGENIKRRLSCIAYELNIPAKDLPKVKKAPTAALERFVDRYGISWDWLLCGDMQGLKRMELRRKARPDVRQRVVARLAKEHGKITPEVLSIVDEEIARALEEPA